MLPTKEIPNTFVAQAYDAGDPCAGGQQCCVNKKDGMGGWPCLPGIAPYTGQFMGGIHPRGPQAFHFICSVDLSDGTGADEQSNESSANGWP